MPRAFELCALLGAILCGCGGPVAEHALTTPRSERTERSAPAEAPGVPGVYLLDEEGLNKACASILSPRPNRDEKWAFELNNFPAGSWRLVLEEGGRFSISTPNVPPDRPLDPPGEQNELGGEWKRAGYYLKLTSDKIKDWQGVEFYVSLRCVFTGDAVVFHRWEQWKFRVPRVLKRAAEGETEPKQVGKPR